MKYSTLLRSSTNSGYYLEVRNEHDHAVAVVQPRPLLVDLDTQRHILDNMYMALRAVFGDDALAQENEALRRELSQLRGVLR